jgi:hypothetical protein
MSWFGPKRCNCTCNVDPCECYPSGSGCAAPAEPTLTITNVPDFVWTSIDRRFAECPGRPCNPSGVLGSNSYIEITGLSQINGTYPSLTYVRNADGYYSRSFSEEAYDPNVCKWWGFAKPTFTLGYSWSWTSPFSNNDSSSPGYLECDDGATNDIGMGSIDVVFDPLMGTIYTKDANSGLSSTEQWLLSLIFRGPGIIKTHDPNTRSPAEPVTFTRNITTFTCAKSGVPAPAWLDDADTYTRAWNSPFKHGVWDGRENIGSGGLPPSGADFRTEGVGMLYSPRSPLKPTGGLYRMLPQIPGTLPLGVGEVTAVGDYYGYAVETTNAIYVKQSFCHLLMETSDISTASALATSGDDTYSTECDIYTEENFSPFRVTRTWTQ